MKWFSLLAVIPLSPLVVWLVKVVRDAKKGAPLLLVAFLSLHCGGASPTAADLAIPTPVPPFIFTGATASEQQQVLTEWSRLSACIGSQPTAAKLVSFTVQADKPLYCGTILAAGCTTDIPTVTVRREWFSNAECLPGYSSADCHAMPTELLHLALLLDHQDWGYSNPAFAKCIG